MPSSRKSYDRPARKGWSVSVRSCLVGALNQTTMPGPYFQKDSWEPFVYEGSIYTLSHLDEHEIAVVDSAKRNLLVAVTYEDHCFTQKLEPGNDPALHYANSSRERACFSMERYRHSLSLPDYISSITTGKVWNVEEKNFALLPVITESDRKMFYIIIFSLDPVKGLPVQLHLRVKTAYPRDSQPAPTTYGSVRFAHLAALRYKRKYPKKIFDRSRQHPKIS